MDDRREWKILAVILAVFLLCAHLPVGWPRFERAVIEALALVRWYAREHVLLCLVPAFFIAGAIAVFVSQASVMKYLGAGANKVLAYGVASVAGTILAVCSCTVLPLFAGVYRMGAGLGPACTFLYSGPAINVLAMILTARVLGWELGLARGVGAVAFSILIGLCMHLLFRSQESERAAAQGPVPVGPQGRGLWQTGLYFACMVAILVFANWARSGDVRAVFLCCPGGLQVYEKEGDLLEETPTHVRLLDANGVEHRIRREELRSLAQAHPDGLQQRVYGLRWGLVAALGLALALMLRRWFSPGELADWCGSSWGFAKQILPLLLLGVLAAGFLLGRPGGEGVVPSRYVQMLVGDSPDGLLAALAIRSGVAESVVRQGWPVWTNLFAAGFGALMYFATLTEVPILQGLLGAGMGKGPALALLLAGPALSLPNMLVIRSVLGNRKTLAFVLLVVGMATASGVLFGALCA